MDKWSHLKKSGMYVLIISLSFILVHNVLANPGAPVKLLSPVLLPDGQAAEQITQKQIEPFIKRTGNVLLGSLDIFHQELASFQNKNGSSGTPAFKEMHLLISFFPEREISIIVDSESHTANNVISLGGHQANSDISTFSMTITQDNFSVTYQDIDNAVTYRVVGDVKTGRGKVIEIDLKKIPPRYDADPVIPRDN
jgi:hypothetical protein